jgi:probable phosphoglycerate mutase
MAKSVAQRLKDVRLDTVYSSPIERTWETAAEIAQVHAKQVQREDGLLEVDYGAWSGRTLKSLYRLKAWRVVQQTPSRMVFPEGESLAAAQSRAVVTVERLAKAHGKATIAAVTHADVIKAVVAHYLGTPLDLFQRIGVAPASVSVIDLPTDGQPHVVAVNTNGDPSTWR